MDPKTDFDPETAEWFLCRVHGDGPGTCRVVRRCRECGRRFISPALHRSKLEELASRHVQDVLPGWIPADRELFFVSGICGACYDRIMAQPEGGDEEA